MKNLFLLDENNVVINAIVVDEETYSKDISTVQSELSLSGNWIKSDSLSAGIGFKYNQDKNRLDPPQPFTSWNWSEELLEWLPPVTRPLDTAAVWDEDNLYWTIK